MPTHPGELEQLVLFAVLRLQGRAYGVAVRRLILERTGRAVSPGGLYTILARLQERGLVASRPAESAPERGGRRRVFYRLTPEGAAALRAAHEALVTMAEGVLSDLQAVEESSR